MTFLAGCSNIQKHMENETPIQTAQRLKSEGYSYNSIGKMLGIGKTTARDWVIGDVKQPKMATISLEIPIPYIKTPQQIEAESEDLKDFILNLEPIHFSAPIRPLVKTAPNKIALVIGDTHFGSEAQDVLDIFLKTVEEMKPETVIINGDSLDMFAISRYPKDIRINSSLLKERLAYHKFLKSLHDITASYNSDIYETNSNHSGDGVEGRYWRYLSDRIGELASIPEIKEKLSYESIFFPHESWSRIKLVDYVELVPGFIIIHGDVVRKHGGYSALGMLEKWGNISMIINHTHRFGATSKRIPSIGSQKEKIVRVFENGCACDLSPCYASAANWQNSFAIVNYSNTHNEPAVEQVLVTDRRACIASLGKTIKV